MRAPSETPKFIRRSPISDSLSKYSGFAVAQFVDSVVEAANKAGISARVLSRAKHQAGTLFDPIFLSIARGRGFIMSSQKNLILIDFLDHCD